MRVITVAAHALTTIILVAVVLLGNSRSVRLVLQKVAIVLMSNIISVKSAQITLRIDTTLLCEYLVGEIPHLFHRQTLLILASTKMQVLSLLLFSIRNTAS